MMNLVIVGGGTAGWMAAGYLKKTNPNFSITLIESPAIPKIGVGESVTPHVAAFFNDLGVPVEHWMQHTGSVYKYANKFTDWSDSTKERGEYFSFTYTTNINALYRDIQHVTSFEEMAQYGNYKTTDAFLALKKEGKIGRFDTHFDTQYHYMENNVAPFDGKTYLLNPLYSWSQHINADLAAEYIRDNIAKPLGVRHIQAKVQNVVHEGDNITSLELDNGQSVVADLFIDASGFNKVLVKALGWAEQSYRQNPVNAAWVCQVDYDDYETEMVNYTQSIAKDYGWLFKIGLYHRMGTGYCFSRDYVSEEQALEQYLSYVPNAKRRDPKLIKWTPQRLVEPAKGNCVAIGLSCGFVEPMEANALYIIVSSIRKLNTVFERAKGSKQLNFKQYNEEIAYAIDDIADFIKVHYSLSNQNKNDMWKDMISLGVRDNHLDLVVDKYLGEKNNMQAAWNGNTLFPDYMWAQLASAWDLVDDKFPVKAAPDITLLLSKLFFTNQNLKHEIISRVCPNNFQWLKSNIFGGMMPNEWENKFLGH